MYIHKMLKFQDLFPECCFKLEGPYFCFGYGQLGVLHLSGIFGEYVGLYMHNILWRKTLASYEWSIIDAPESEEGNVGYCTKAHGTPNYIEGVMDALDQDYATDSGSLSKIRRRGHNY